jgi:hypothetical protein
VEDVRVQAMCRRESAGSSSGNRGSVNAQKPG